MISTTLFPDALLATAGAIAGCVLGLLYFAVLRRAVGELIIHKRWQRAVGWSLARIGAGVTVLGVIARFGAIALLAALLGLLLARAYALRDEAGVSAAQMR